MCKFFCKGRGCGFTLVELLVVIAIIAVLLGILIPVMAFAKEKGRRVLCSSHVRQFIIGIHTYGNGNDEHFPSGICDARDEHTPIISTLMRNALIESIGGVEALTCPWLMEPFTDAGGFYYGDDPDEPEGNYGYVLGYNYLGGHSDTPWSMFHPNGDPYGPAEDEWTSPQTTSDKASMPLVTELNTWTTYKNWTFAPHGAKGPIYEGKDSTNQSMGGAPSAEIGAAGGNIGLVGGSVSWKKMKDMKVYRSSISYGNDGCFSAW